MPGYRAARTGVVMSGQLLVALCGALLQNTVANVRLVKLKRPSRKLTSQLCRPANTLKHCWYSVILLIHRHSKLGSRRYTPTMNLRCRGPSSQATLTGKPLQFFSWSRFCLSQCSWTVTSSCKKQQQSDLAVPYQVWNQE